MTKACLAIDFGNSETRFTVQCGEIRLAFHTTNTFTKLPAGYSVPERYRNGDTGDSVTTFIEYNGDIYAHGDIVETEFPKSVIRPTTIDKKYRSEATELAIRNALYVATQAISRHTGNATNITGVSKNIEWTIFVLLPPNDIEIGLNEIRTRFDQIRSITRVYPNEDGKFNESAFPNEHTTIKVGIKSVRVVPEGFCAFMGTAFKSLKKFNDGIDQDIITSTILVIDIGSGTTDCCIIDRAKLVSSSMNTIEVGGRNVQNELGRALAANPDFGGNYPEAKVREAAETGKLTIRKGKSVDVTSLVESAKEKVAENIVNGVTRYLESSDFAPNSIAYILPCGGGAIKGDIKSLSEYVCEYVQRSAKFSEVLEIPENVSPRDLNIVGASIISENA